MANFEVKNLNSLLKRIDEIGQVPTTKRNEIVTKAANVALEKIREDAKKKTGKSAAALNIVAERSNGDSLFLDVGINSTNWEETKGLYYQHYGFYDVQGTLWMTSSFKSANKLVKKTITDSLIEELGL